MAKGHGGGGRSSKRVDSGYGRGVSVVKNSGNISANSFVSSQNISERIVVSKAKIGTEKQIEYATNIKQEAMSNVDRTIDNLIRRGANKEKSISLRNKLFSSINKETDSKRIIDSVRGKDASQLMKLYGLKT